MIRFIDLRGQHTQSKFAFFDTVTDTFMSFNGDQAFDDWPEFEYSFNCSSWPELENIRRFHALIPAWVWGEQPTHAHHLCSIRRKSDGMVVYAEWVYTDGTPRFVATSALIDVGILPEDFGMYEVTVEEGLGKGFEADK